MTKPKCYTVLRGITVLTCIVSIMSILLPVMGGDSIHPELSAHILIRGINLFEFSGYGFAFFIAPLLLMTSHLLTENPRRRVLLLLAVCIGYFSCYVLNLSAGWQWLQSLESIVPITRDNVSIYAGLWLIPAAFLLQAVVTAIDILSSERNEKATDAMTELNTVGGNV